MFKDEKKITSDYWDDGPIETSFWRVPQSIESFPRRPLGVRTLPFVDGPRTNEGIFPGEVIEICQILRKDGNVFLRLADDRGWLFESHPTGLL